MTEEDDSSSDEEDDHVAVDSSNDEEEEDDYDEEEEEEDDDDEAAAKTKRKRRPCPTNEEEEDDEADAKPKRKQRPCPTDKTKPAATVEVTSRLSKQMCFFWGTNRDHLKRYGQNHTGCARCDWIHKFRDAALARFTYKDADGTVGSWVEEVCRPDHAWGLGCLLCREHKGAAPCGRRSCGFREGAIRVYKAWKFKRHQMSSQHKAAVQWMLSTSGSTAPAGGVAPIERGDVPPYKHFMQAYTNCKQGRPYQNIEEDFRSADRAGGTIVSAWRSRRCCTQMVEAMAFVLNEDAASILEQCTHISITKDSRKKYVVVRARCVMGNGWADGHLPRSLFEDRADGGFAPGTEPTCFYTASGRGGLTVDLLLLIWPKKAYENLIDKAEFVEKALRRVLRKAGTDDVDAAFARVSLKVRSFCPDGAADEQLACRFASSSSFPNSDLVLRCSTHTMHGALKGAWNSDVEVKRITKQVVDEVGKFLRYSDRFQQRFAARARHDILQVVENFSFAPQRFGSRANTFSRMVLFAEHVMLVIADEVVAPSKPERKKWAQQLLHDLSPETWLLIGALSDLASDSETFLRFFDSHGKDGGVAPDPVAAAVALGRFVDLLRTQYMGSQFLYRKNTYTAKIWNWLSEAKVLQVESTVFALDPPDHAARTRIVARVASVAEACLRYVRADNPRCAPQCLAGAFALPPPDNAQESVRLLARYLQWEKGREDDLVAEFNEAGARAVAHKEKSVSGHLDAWMAVVEKHREWPNLLEVLLSLHCLLITETQCERDFSKDCWATGSQRNKLSPLHRWCNLKIIADGAPLSYLCKGDTPIGPFFKRAQDVYASRFGTRALVRMKRRSDGGKKKSKKQLNKRAGKPTVVSLKRKRAEEMRKALNGGIAPTGLTVFGDDHLDAAEVKRVRLELQAESDLFATMIAKTDAKRKKKQEMARALEQRQPGALKLSQLSPKMIKGIKTRLRDVKDRISGNFFRGKSSSRVDFQRLRTMLGGDPLVYTVSSDHLEGRGLDEPLCETRTLRHFCYSRGSLTGNDLLADFCLHPSAMGRRVFLVPRLSKV